MNSPFGSPSAAATSCRGCGSALVAGQRYCLGCGARNPAEALPVASAAMLTALGVAAAAGGAPPVASASAATAAGAAGGGAATWLAGLGPKGLAAVALSLLASGTLIGSAFSPPAEDTLAAGRQVIIVQGPGTQAQGPPAPAPVVSVPAPAPLTPGFEQPLAPQPVEPPPVVPPVPPTPVPPPYVEPTAIGHEFVVMLPGDGTAHPLARRSNPKGLMRKRAHAAVDGDFLSTTLVPQGALLTGFKQISQSNIANRIAMFTGQPANPDTSAGCTGTLKKINVADDFSPGNSLDPTNAGCIYPDLTGDIMDHVLSSNGYQMNIYVEANKAQVDAGLCSPPAEGSSVSPSVDGAPDVRDNPFLWLTRYAPGSDCSDHIRSIDRLSDDLAADAADSGCKVTPSPYDNPHCMAPLTLVIPSRCRSAEATKCPTDSDATGAAGLDQFLTRYVSGKVMKSKTYLRDGLISVGYTGADAATDSAATGPTGLLLLSPFVKAGTTNKTAFTTYDLLYTLMSRLSFGDPSAGGTMLARANPLPAKDGGFAAKEFPKTIYSKTLSPAVAG